jgi:hypothetical protein
MICCCCPALNFLGIIALYTWYPEKASATAPRISAAIASRGFRRLGSPCSGSPG